MAQWFLIVVQQSLSGPLHHAVELCDRISPLALRHWRVEMANHGNMSYRLCFVFGSLVLTVGYEGSFSPNKHTSNTCGIPDLLVHHQEQH